MTGFCSLSHLTHFILVAFEMPNRKNVEQYEGTEKERRREREGIISIEIDAFYEIKLETYQLMHVYMSVNMALSE